MQIAQRFNGAINVIHIVEICCGNRTNLHGLTIAERSACCLGGIYNTKQSRAVSARTTRRSPFLPALFSLKDSSILSTLNTKECTMPSVDMPLEQLRQYKPSLNRQEDFDSYWDSTISAALKQPMNAELIPYD